MHNVLVLGGAGFLGSFVVAELVGSFQLSVLERSGCNLSRIHAHMEKVIINYTDDLDLNKYFSEKQFDVIINCSVSYGLNEPLSQIMGTNVIFPLKIIESISGSHTAFINTDTFFNKPGNIGYKYLRNYIFTKKCLEEILQHLDPERKIINLKLEHLYGPGDNETKFIPSMINRLQNNETEIEMTDGTQARDFIFVRDAARAYRSVIENIDRVNPGYTGISVGTGTCTTIKELVSLMKVITNSQSVLKFGALPQRQNEIMHSTGDPQFLRSLGWRAGYDLKRGLTEIIR